ncbi:ABC transporter permease [Metallibacterium sp.]|uniref:ABC transporter permease n=1 Tax=Metallibacterium sp. TaxID=2940281 RepID=UPI00262B52BD|nr:ABC transporter permease [Metallibacterium sp.]
MKRRIAAYLMLSVALAATVFCYTLLQGMAGDHIRGASSQRRYFTLGVQMTSGVNDAVSTELVDQLGQRLPHSFAVATSLDGPPEFSSLALPDGSKRVDMALDMVRGQYFQAVDLRHVLGRVISPAAAHANAPVIVINRRCADALFGSAQAALDRALILHIGGGSSAGPRQVRVIGVIMGSFTGIRAYDEHFRHQPVAWVPLSFPIGTPTLLSVPANLPQAEVRHELDLAWSGLPASVRGVGNHGLVFTQPFSTEPAAVATTTHKLGLYLDLAGAALLLTLANLMAVNFLEALRRRTVHAIERTLGATRAWQLRRVLYRALLGALMSLVVSGALLAAALVVVQRAIVALGWFGLMESPWGRVGGVLDWPHLWIPAVALIAAVVLIEVLVHGVLLTREQRASNSMQVSSPRGEQQVGGVILALEFTLAALLAVLAGWGVQYAWRMAHENLGMLQGQRLTLLSTKFNKSYYSMHPDAFAEAVSSAVLAAALRRAIAGIEPHADVAFGPVVGVQFRHGNGNFHDGSGKLEAGQAGIITQKFVASASWLPVGEGHLLAGRNFSRHHPDPHEALIDADVARTLFGSVRAAVGRQVHLKFQVNFQGEPTVFLRVRGVIAPLRLDGPGHAPVASWIQPLQGGDTAARFMGGDILVRPEIPVARDQALLAAVQRVFAKDAPYIEPSGVRSSTQAVSRLDRPQRILATVFGAVAGFGLLIALTGLVVLLRLFLAMRKRVDAIRQALGASPRRQYTGVVVGTLILALAGALLALLFSPWLAQQFALLSGAQVAPFGPATWIALAVLLLAVFLVAHFPARRAARAEPAESLHEL